MTSPTTRTKKRAGLVLLGVLALVGTGTVAWGHGTPTSSIPDAAGTIHACFPNSQPRTLRVVAPTQTCTSSQGGVDWPAIGVLTQMVESPPPTALPVPAGGPGQTASINVTCPPGKVAIGISEFTNDIATSPAAFAGMTRIGTPPGSTVSVTFATLTGGAAQVSNVKALCVTLFS